MKANLRACLARQGPDTVGNPNARPLAISSVPGTPTTSNYGSTNQQPSYRTTTHGPGKSTYQSAMASVLMDTPVAGSEQQRGSSPEPSRDTVPAGQQQCPSEHRAVTSTRDRVPISASRFNNQDPAQVNNHIVLSMAQSLLQSVAVHLTGTHLTAGHVALFIKSLEQQLPTHSYDSVVLETMITPEIWRILNSQILNSQTLKDN